jgi:hypothetical protein
LIQPSYRMWSSQRIRWDLCWQSGWLRRPGSGC